jgi:hypothetical protein
LQALIFFVPVMVCGAFGGILRSKTIGGIGLAVLFFAFCYSLPNL